MKNFVFIEGYKEVALVSAAYPQGGSATIASVMLRYVKAKSLRGAQKIRKEGGGVTATAIQRGMFDNSLWDAGSHVIDLT